MKRMFVLALVLTVVFALAKTVMLSPQAVASSPRVVLIDADQYGIKEFFLSRDFQEMNSLLYLLDKETSSSPTKRALSICLAGRGVFFFYERYEARYGLHLALLVRHDIEQTFAKAIEEVKLLGGKEYADGSLIPDEDLISKCLHSLKERHGFLIDSRPVPRADLR